MIWPKVPNMSHTVLRLLLFVSVSLASYSRLTCTSYNECIYPTSNGTLCYNPNQSNRPREDSVCTNGARQNVMAVHIASSTSIGYYDRRTYERLGDYTYRVIRQVYLCTSGVETDGTYQSACGLISEDDAVMHPACSVAIGQPFVEDGCYTPDSSPAALQVARSVGTIEAPTHTSEDAADGSSPSSISSPSGISTRNQATRVSLPSMFFPLFIVSIVGLM